MATKLNKIQSTYLLAKAHLEALETALVENEREYMQAQGVTNPDGNIPDAIYRIEDEALFDKINEAHGAIIEANGMQAEINEARELLRQAEDALVEWGLSLPGIPAAEREALRQSAQTNFKTRWKVRDLALKLDASTVK